MKPLREVWMMTKKKIKELAIELLQESKLEDIETIAVSENNYHDGTPYVEITVEFKGGENE